MKNNKFLAIQKSAAISGIFFFKCQDPALKILSYTTQFLQGPNTTGNKRLSVKARKITKVKGVFSILLLFCPQL